MESSTVAESFYASLGYDSDDIICEGSDSERTQADIRAKRTRYEERASKIYQGHIPTILSATLKGPFDREHGWTNPWKVRTQSKSLPKAKKSKPRQSSSRARKSGEGKASELGDDDGSGGIDVGEQSGNHFRASQPHDIASHSSHSNSFIPINGESTRAINHCEILISTHNDRSRELSVEASSSHMTGLAKRDPRAWSKGSYVSKTARWDQMDALSPTPLETRTRRSSSSKMVATSAAMRSTVPRPKVIQLDEDESTNLSMKRKSTEESGDYVSSTSNLIRNGSRRSDYDMNDESAQNLLNDQLHRDISQGFADQTVSNVDISQTWHYPVARREQDTHIDLDEHLEDVNGMGVVASFVTDVVPSCRDLEKFQFRKRRRLDTAPQTRVQTPASIVDAVSSEPISLKTFLLERSFIAAINISPDPSAVEPPTEADHLSPSSNGNAVDWETTLGEGFDSVQRTEHSVSPTPLPSVSADIDRSFDVEHLPEDDEDDEWDTTIGEASPTKSGRCSTRRMVRSLPAPRQGSLEATKIPHSSQQLMLLAVEPRSCIQFESRRTSELSESPRSASSTTDDPQNGHETMITLEQAQAPGLEGQCGTDHSLVNQNDISTQSANTTRSRTLGASQMLRVDKADAAHVMGSSSPAHASKFSTIELFSPHRTASSKIILRSPSTNRQSTQSSSSKVVKDFSPLGLDLYRNATSNMLPEVTNSPFDMFKLFQTSVDEPPTHRRSPEHARSEAVSNILPPILSSPAPLLKSRRRTKSATSKPAPSEPANPLVQEDHEPSDPRIIQISSPPRRVEESPDGTTSDRLASAPVTQVSQHSPMVTGAEEESSMLLRDCGTPQASLSSSKSLKRCSRETDFQTENVVEQERSVVQPLSHMQSPDFHGDHEESFMRSLRTSPTPEPASQSPWHQNISVVDITLLPVDELSAVTGDNKVVDLCEDSAIVEEQEQSQWQPFEPVTINTALTKTCLPYSLTHFDPPAMEETPALIAESITPINKLASHNPWASSRRTSHTKKSKKRVSFGVAVDTQQIDDPQSPQAATPVTSLQSSPEYDHNEDVGVYTAKRTITLPNRDCFTAKRPFKRILPNKSASQINSSPAPIDAMAEAFVAADVNKAADEEKSNTPRSLLRSSISPYDSTWTGMKGGITPMGDISEEQENADLDYGIPGFNIDEALGEIGDFLEDWSVEAEVKKAREEEKALESSNPVRRSRYFGMA